MIFILFLVHLLSRGLNPTDSCDDINNCRRLFDIVWGCATTIFAATWVSVHPNNWLALLWRRLKMMLVAVIAPEVMVGFATRQFVMARYGSNERSQLRIYASAIKEIQVGAIKDKSKGDALSKAVALFQGLWFITQCIARATQHLPVMELEVATLAFAVVNIFIWLLWTPIILGTSEEGFAAQDSYCPGVHASGNPTALTKFIFRLRSMLEHVRIPSVVASFVGAIFGAIHCAAWNSHFPSANEKWMWWLVLEILVLSIFDERTYFIQTKSRFFKAAFAAFIPLYIIARLFLLIIPFTSLRTLTPDTFVDVNWSVYIPHL
ncbi:hypothetical protein B0H14DRAFT_2693790 [Mycena olivaceomarginata]|nr:hypothetical protein B0H14DRAFT_2693790 [Mycena olivaceomarginata]